MKYGRWLVILGAGLSMTLAGCSFGLDVSAPQATPTPVPQVTEAPTATPVPTSTPVPTVTPEPKLIGSKTADARLIYLTNSSGKKLKQFYIRISGYEDWGKSLIQTENSIRNGEQVRMYYVDQAGEGGSYDVRFVTENNMYYEIYGVQLSDMERATLQLDENYGSMYLTYKSLRDSSDQSTLGYNYSSDSTSYDQDYDYDYDESYYDDSSEQSSDWDEQIYYYEEGGDEETSEDYSESTSTDIYYEETTDY